MAVGGARSTFQSRLSNEATVTTGRCNRSHFRNRTGPEPSDPSASLSRQESLCSTGVSCQAGVGRRVRQPSVREKQRSSQQRWFQASFWALRRSSGNSEVDAEVRTDSDVPGGPCMIKQRTDEAPGDAAIRMSTVGEERTFKDLLRSGSGQAGGSRHENPGRRGDPTTTAQSRIARRQRNQERAEGAVLAAFQAQTRIPMNAGWSPAALAALTAFISRLPIMASDKACDICLAKPVRDDDGLANVALCTCDTRDVDGAGASSSLRCVGSTASLHWQRRGRLRAWQE